MKTTTTTPSSAAPRAARPRRPYVAPAIEVIEMENEGVIASSGNLPGYGDDDMFSSGSSSQMRNNSNSYNAASFSELEDAINDILTFEK